MYIISEQLNEGEYEFITESTDTNKDYYLTGIYGQAEIVNKNRRFYTLDEMTKACDKIQASIKSKKKLFGEMHHPKTAEIDFDRAAIRIDELYMEGNDLMGKAKICRGMPKGDLLYAMVAYHNSVPPVSTRSTGSLTEQRQLNRFLVGNLNFITVDIVNAQSAPGATPDAICENVN